MELFMVLMGITLIFISCMLIAWVIIGATKARKVSAKKQKELDEWVSYWQQLNNQDESGC